MNSHSRCRPSDSTSERLSGEYPNHDCEDLARDISSLPVDLRKKNGQVGRMNEELYRYERCQHRSSRIQNRGHILNSNIDTCNSADIRLTGNPKKVVRAKAMCIRKLICSLNRSVFKLRHKSAATCHVHSDFSLQARVLDGCPSSVLTTISLHKSQTLALSRHRSYISNRFLMRI